MKASPRSPLQRIVIWLHCNLAGHQYRVLRRMNQGARKVGCDRCGKAWGMHDETRSFVPWDSDLESVYAPGGPLGPEQTDNYALSRQAGHEGA